MPVGRKPKPTVDKKLEGNPGGRKLNDHEAQPHKLSHLPDPPEWLGDHAVRAWKENGPGLIDAGLLTESDLELFASLCQNIHIMITASEDIKIHGMTIIGARGKTRNPALATFASATTAVRNLAAEFGMSPSSRSRIKIPDADGPSLGDFDQEESEDIE